MLHRRGQREARRVALLCLGTWLTIACTSSVGQAPATATVESRTTAPPAAATATAAPVASPTSAPMVLATATVEPAEPTAAPSAEPTQAASPCWPTAELAAHNGQRGCVEGNVQRVVYAETSSGQPTFINLPDNVTCLIWGRNRAKWQPVPEVQYTGKRVRCQGEVQLFRGNPQIELMVPDQISVVG